MDFEEDEVSALGGGDGDGEEGEEEHTMAQLRTLAIIPKVTATLSIIGSAFVARDICVSRTKKSSTFFRLLLGMAIADMMGSFWMALSNWPIPSWTEEAWRPAGNQATCSAQGFFLTLLIAAPLYNSSLSNYYMLVGTFGWSLDRVRQVEPYMHAIPWLFGVTAAFVGLGFKQYNNNDGMWCWISPLPEECRDSYRHPGEGNCVRGDNAWIFRWALLYGPLWASTLFSMACMVIVYFSVLKTEKITNAHRSEEGEATRERSRRVALQALLYLLCFYVAWLPATIEAILDIVDKRPYGAELMVATLTPLQGFLNYWVYTRSKYLRYRRSYPKPTAWEAFKKAILPRKQAPRRPAEQTPEVTGVAKAKKIPIAKFDPTASLERFDSAVLDHINYSQTKNSAAKKEEAENKLGAVMEDELLEEQPLGGEPPDSTKEMSD